MHRPLRWHNTACLNNYSHRKLLFFSARPDSLVGLPWQVGGPGNAQDSEHWCNSRITVESPVAPEMQAVLFDDRAKTNVQIVHDGEYLPALDTAGHPAAWLCSSCHDPSSESINLTCQLARAAVEISIDLPNAYVVPGGATKPGF